MSLFFRAQERLATFKKITDRGGWDTAVESSFTVSGIVSLGSVSINPSNVEDEGSMGMRFFTSLSNQTLMNQVEVGDVVEVDGAGFEVSKVDSRGVLPGRYPIRVEAVRKV